MRTMSVFIRTGMRSAAGLYAASAELTSGGRKFISENHMRKSSGAAISTSKTVKNVGRKQSDRISSRRHSSGFGTGWPAIMRKS